MILTWERRLTRRSYNIGGDRTATSTGKRDEFGHLIGIANDTGETVKLNDWVLPGGIHARYDRVNRKTGEVIVTDGIGEYTTAQIKNPGISSGVTAAEMMPPNNTPDPSDLADLLLQSQQQHNNDQPDYSNDTSFLYAKNVSKALLEQALDRIGGKYGASHLGTAAITGSGVVTDYMQGKSAEDILLNAIFTGMAGKGGKAAGGYIKLNPEITSGLVAAGADTYIDQSDNENKKQKININK